MSRPRMVIVAGPPGSGKTTRFPLADFGVDYFNADNRAAELNGGSFRGISKEIRSQVNIEFQRWILDHISERNSFALETTLRSDITFEQARLAHEHGFETALYFVTTGDVEESIRRIKARAYRGGHSASEGLVREIYQKSMRNLVAALDSASGIDFVDVYDNSANLAEQKTVRPALSLEYGRATYVVQPVPDWLGTVLRDAGFFESPRNPAESTPRTTFSRQSVEGKQRTPKPQRDDFDLDR